MSVQGVVNDEARRGLFGLCKSSRLKIENTEHFVMGCAYDNSPLDFIALEGPVLSIPLSRHMCIGGKHRGQNPYLL